jgi:hypothetical protein
VKNDMGLRQRILLKYELAGRWQINVKGWTLVTMVAGGIVVFGLSFVLGIIIRDLLRGVYEGQFSVGGLISFPIILGVIVAAIILHEAIHGVLFLVLGGKPRFGMKLIGRFFPAAYATSTVPILRNQYLLVCLGPFLMLTLIFMLSSILATNDNIAGMALMAMALNVSGSIGDLMVAYKVRRYGRWTLFEDTQDGFIWYIPSING